jgi:20S proteasome alpha/beta subunit
MTLCHGGGNPMTVCVGALCEDGKTVVVAADKMVTFGAPMSLQMEPPVLKKITQITEESVVLFSGSVPDAEEIVALAKQQIKGLGKLATVNVAESVKNAYIALKAKRVQETILGPLIGADFAKFQSLLVQSSSSQVLQQLLAMVMQHNLQTEALLAGVDDLGGHLFAVTHPGVLLPMETTGYAAVGSGGVHAAVRLSLGQHNKVASLVDTVYNVYEAKRAAEVAPGVGTLTDLAIIKNGKVCFAQKALFESLEKAHKEKPTPTASEQEELKKVCDDCTGTGN